MKQIVRLVRKRLGNDRGDISIFTCFFVVGVSAYKSGFRLAVQLILEGRISYLTSGKEDSCE